MILTFEGGPATGKSTVADKLASTHACYTVPEVNKLFCKENRISDICYYQKQCERWALSLQGQESAVLSILDGDVFQPIWFGLLFPSESWEDFGEMVNFYSDMLERNQIGFPNIKQEFPGLVLFLESNNIKSSVETILSSTKELHYDDREIFTFIIDWCERQRKENN